MNKQNFKPNHSFEDFGFELACWIRDNYKIDEIKIAPLYGGNVIEFKISGVAVWSFVYDSEGLLMQSSGHSSYMFIDEFLFPKELN